MPSLKKNFFYSALLTVANYVFPLITYPYVSRVLGVANIGICNFVDNIVNWFIVFSTMGVSVLGVREIAAAREDKESRSRTFSDLLALTGITTLVAALVLLGAIFLVPKLVPYRTLLLVGVAKLVAHSLSLEWFFGGMEEFRYITARSIAVKILYVVSVFLFVRKADDYWIYYLLLSGSVLVNMLANVLYSRHLTRFSLKGVDLKRFAAPFFILGLNYLLASVYSTFNTVYLGFALGPEQVGYYTSATKILTIIIALISAFTTVLLPRMSAVLTDGRKEEFFQYVDAAINTLFLVGIPGMFFIQTEAYDIVRIISGPGYEGAAVPMMMIAPMVLIGGLDQILIIQTMMPLKMDRQIVINSAIGAVVGFLLALLLVRPLGARGSAIVWICSELAVCLGAATAVFRKDFIPFPARKVLKVFLLYLPLLGFLLLLRNCGISHFVFRALASMTVCLVYFIIVSVVILKDPVVLESVRWLPFRGKNR